MAGEKHLSDARSDGLLIGQSSTDTVGFFGTDPAAQQSMTVTVTTTATTTALADDLADIRGALVTLGLLTTS